VVRVSLEKTVDLSEYAKAHGLASVIIRALSARTMFAMQRQLRDVPDGDIYRMTSVQLSAYAFNAEGAQVWPTPDDAFAALDNISANDVKSILDVADDLNGFDDDALEETEKN
jgi:hypothetical protein